MYNCKEDKEYIFQGKPEAFLICDKRLRNHENEVIDWLKKEGFSFGGKNGDYGCEWIHVSITKMLYAYGRPGVGIVHETGNHAITFEEFKAIYGIFKKYRGKELFVFHSKRFDYDE